MGAAESLRRQLNPVGIGTPVPVSRITAPEGYELRWVVETRLVPKLVPIKDAQLSTPTNTREGE
jgi:hypothetical protein